MISSAEFYQTWGLLATSAESSAKAGEFVKQREKCLRVLEGRAELSQGRRMGAL